MANCYPDFGIEEASNITGPVYLDLNTYFECILVDLWSNLKIILIGVAIIMIMYLIYKTVTNRENAKVLETLPMDWARVLLFAIVVIGGGGTILNILLKFFGFGDFQFWLDNFVNFLKLDWI